MVVVVKKINRPNLLCLYSFIFYYLQKTKHNKPVLEKLLLLFYRMSLLFIYIVYVRL